MTTPSLSFNYMATTVAPGSFQVSADGLVQGMAFDDPAIRNQLAIGVLSTSETLPMWAGVALYENIPAVGTVMGPTLGRATSVAAITGFSVGNQAAAWVTTPQSECPSAGGGQTVPFFRFGSGIRLCLQIDPTFAATIDAGSTGTTVQASWDLVNQKLIAYTSGTVLPVRILGVNLTSKVISIDASNNVHYGTGACAVVLI